MKVKIDSADQIILEAETDFEMAFLASTFQRYSLSDYQMHVIHSGEEASDLLNGEMDRGLLLRRGEPVRPIVFSRTEDRYKAPESPPSPSGPSPASQAGV